MSNKKFVDLVEQYRKKGIEVSLTKPRSSMSLFLFETKEINKKDKKAILGVISCL
jgi:hypothetical protein